MRARHLVLGFATSALLTAAAATVIGVGCGGSSSDNSGTPDASNGGDAVVDHFTPPVDAGTDAPKDTGVACAVDADLNTFNPPDASIGDSGATTGGCVTCTRAKCGSELNDCNGDCDCKQALLDFFACIQTGKSLISCGQSVSAGLPPDTTATLQALGLCLYGGCKTECNVPTLGGDAGKDGATDAQADAPDGD